MPVTINGSNTPTAGSVTYGDGTTYANTAAGTAGFPLLSAGSSAPTFAKLAVANISATGSPSGSNYLRGDGAWASIDLTTVTSSVINTSTAAVAGTYYLITATLTLTLPASPSAGNFVAFSNISGTTTPVIARNSLNIMALAEDLTLNSTQARGTLVYTDATNGWVLFND